MTVTAIMHTAYVALYTVGFVVTTLLLVWANRVVQRRHPAWYPTSLIPTTIVALVLLGVLWGWLAALLTWLLSVRWFVTLQEGRRFGKQVARHIGIRPNLLFSALDIGLPPTYLGYLQHLGREGRSADYAALRVAQGLEFGLTALHQRFGDQEELLHALSIVPSFLERANQEGVWDDPASAGLA